MAAVDARLGGKFKVTITITGGDSGSIGDKVKRDYKFKSTCPGKGSCDEVVISRQTSTGSFVTQR
jgi:hypothetical protein